MKFFTPSFSQLRKVGFILVALFAMTSGVFAQNATNGGQIAANQTICPGETPDPFTSNSPASGGDPNLPIEYLWMVGSSVNFPSGYVNAPGSNNGLTYNAPALGSTSYFIRCARRQGFTEFQAESNIVVVTVLNSPTAVINGAPNGPIYTGGTVNFSADFSINSNYSWDFDGNGFPNTFGQSGSFTYFFPGTYPVTLTVTNSEGCTATTTVEITVLAPTGANIADPCGCTDPQNFFTPTQVFLHDYILINSNPGETWTLSNVAGTLFDANGNPIPNGTVIPESAPGVYYLDVWFIDGTGGYSATFFNGITTVSTTQSGANCGCTNPLPVGLISFEASTIDGDVQLKWATSSESNNSHFELEKSLDGNRFDVITKIDGAGNSSTVQTYSFMDKDAFEGINYYRLKQVDIDGTFEYFTAITAKVETGSTVLHVLPNPVKDVARIRLDGVVSDNAVLQLVSVTGQLIRTVAVTNVGGIQEINLEDVQSGVYFLNLIDSSEEKVFQKVIKQ